MKTTEYSSSPFGSIFESINDMVCYLLISIQKLTLVLRKFNRSCHSPREELIKYMPQFSPVDHEFMSRALNLACEAADLGEVPVGAVLVRQDTVIGEGFNAPVSSHDATSHAEIRAIRDAGQRSQNYRIPGSTLYVTLEPCTLCFGACIHARIERIVYAAKEPRAGVLGSQIRLQDMDFYNHRIVVEEGLCAEESARLLRRFFQLRR